METDHVEGLMTMDALNSDFEADIGSKPIPLLTLVGTTEHRLLGPRSRYTSLPNDELNVADIRLNIPPKVNTQNFMTHSVSFTGIMK